MPSLSLGLSLESATRPPLRIWYGGVNNTMSGLLLSPQTLGMLTGTAGSTGVKTLTFPAIGVNGSNFVASFHFAPNGDLWAAYNGNAAGQTVAKFSASTVAAGGAMTADVVLHLPSAVAASKNPVGIAMNAAGDLWIGTATAASTIFGFTAAQIQTSGTPTPITLKSTSWTTIQEITFDAAGNLWVASFGASTISRITPAQMAADNLTLTPAVLLTITSGLDGCVLDTQGNLWTSNFNNSTVRKYLAADINATGTPTAAVAITGSMNGPGQIYFDGAQNLWVASFTNGHIYQFSAADLATSGAKTPASDITYLANAFAVRVGTA